MSPSGRRPPPRRAGPGHPGLTAALLVLGVTVLIIVLAAVSAFGSG